MVLINRFAGLEERYRLGEQTLDMAGEGQGRTNGESSIDIYTLPCVKQRARRKPQYIEHGEPSLVLCSDG